MRGVEVRRSLDRRAVLASVCIALSGCTSDIGGGLLGTNSTNVEGCREDQNDGLLIIRPTESVSDETWTEIMNVIETRYDAVGGYSDKRIQIQQINGSRAVTVAIPWPDRERYRRLYLGDSTFSVFVGSSSDWTEIINDSTYDTLGNLFKRGGKWGYTIRPSAGDLDRLRAAISRSGQNLKIRTVVKGETVGQSPLPDGLSTAVSKGEDIRGLYAPIDAQNESDAQQISEQIRLAGQRPPFRVPITSDVYKCTDGAADEGDG